MTSQIQSYLKINKYYANTHIIQFSFIKNEIYDIMTVFDNSIS